MKYSIPTDDSRLGASALVASTAAVEGGHSGPPSSIACWGPTGMAGIRVAPPQGPVQHGWSRNHRGGIPIATRTSSNAWVTVRISVRKCRGLCPQRRAKGVQHRPDRSVLARLLRHDPEDADWWKPRLRKYSDQPAVAQLIADDVVREPGHTDSSENRVADDHDVVGAQGPVHGDRLLPFGRLEIPRGGTAILENA